jgi:alkaline phosphatase D
VASGFLNLTRRDVLLRGAAASALPLLGVAGCASQPSVAPAGSAAAQGSRIFSLGVASGEPTADGVVLWTRLAPDPLRGGGMGPAPVPVRWEVGTDESMRTVVRRGTVMARPERAHAVHVEVPGLAPRRWYWYRFDAGGEVSVTGRTRTAPAPGEPIGQFRFAVASCQNYQHGYFTAYRHMAAEEIDLVVHLGDYIYEGRARKGFPRSHGGAEAETLAGYRARYALYKMDPDLQAAHAAFPWCVVSDDHEVNNDYANDREVRDRVSPADFLRRRAAAYRAYYEHMPFRPAQLPRGADMRLYRSLELGGLVDLNLLDTRQYRTDQPCTDDGEKWYRRCTDAERTAATMLGRQQEAWLEGRLAAGRARWSVLAQQVPIMERMRKVQGEARYNMDKWDGYKAARDRLFAAVGRHHVPGFIALSGDVHSAWAGTLRADFQDPRSAALGTEFVTTSISSGGNGRDMRPRARKMLAANPGIAFFNGRRGYTRCTVTPDIWRSDYRVVPYVDKPGAPIRTAASFAVTHGQSGPHSV